MKNIHVLPTDKPSRLIINWEKDLCYKSRPYLMEGTQHIYITSDEKIKEGDWVVQVNFEKTNTQLIQCVTEFQVKIANDKDGSFTKKKIILTTDKDLIKDDVQPIDDEFLEWFVKNSSCESVDVDLLKRGIYDEYKYLIIIPKEEPKLQCKDCNDNLTDCTCIEDTINMKKETLEEVAERKFENIGDRLIFEDGAKWQQERMYNEEDLKSAWNASDINMHSQFSSSAYKGITFNQWFEQFKKK